MDAPHITLSSLLEQREGNEFTVDLPRLNSLAPQLPRPDHVHQPSL